MRMIRNAPRLVQQEGDSRANPDFVREYACAVLAALCSEGLLSQSQYEACRQKLTRR